MSVNIIRNKESMPGMCKSHIKAMWLNFSPSLTGRQNVADKALQPNHDIDGLCSPLRLAEGVLKHTCEFILIQY